MGTNETEGIVTDTPPPNDPTPEAPDDLFGGLDYPDVILDENGRVIEYVSLDTIMGWPEP